MRLVKPAQNLLQCFSTDRVRREYARFHLAKRFASLVYPKFRFVGEASKTWVEDERFVAAYEEEVDTNYAAADRVFFLRSVLGLADGIPGDTAECGVLRGASSWFICRHFQGTGKTHYLFDSFEGLSTPDGVDGQYFQKGDFLGSEEIVRKKLAAFDICVLRGWIPERFAEARDRTFCFVHIDVDLYQPTYDSLAFFYPRVAKGGVILCDDYGFLTCPGATRAFDEFLSGKPERAVHVPTGQCFIVKK